jgi:hypothetical protein
MEVDFCSGIELLEIKRNLHSFYRINKVFLDCPTERIAPTFFNDYFSIDKFISQGLAVELVELDYRFDVKVVRSGSSTEAVSLFGNHSRDEIIEQEYDFLMIVEPLEVSEKEKDGTLRINTEDGTVSSGYSWINVPETLLETWRDCVTKAQTTATDDFQHFLSSSKMVNKFSELISKAFEKFKDQLRTDEYNTSSIYLRIETNGPAITVVIDLNLQEDQATFSFDFVLAIHCKEWPTQALEWSTRKREWPDSSIVSNITRQ